VTRLILNEKYTIKKDYDTGDKYLPLRDYAKKGEIVRYTGKSLGNAHFDVLVDEDKLIRRIIMTAAEAFEYLELS